MLGSRSSQQFGWHNFSLTDAIEADVSQNLKSSVWGDDADGLEVASLHWLAGGFGGVSGASGSNAAHVSSMSSKSTSVDSSSLGKTSMINPCQESPTLSIQRGLTELKNVAASSASLDASVESLEPVISLKLGKRTYFEDLCNASNVRASVSDKPVTSDSIRRSRSSYKTTQIIRCQVEGCNLDLSAAKEYNRKHRICVNHSKCPRIIVGGLERRFCQQCSRFHSLTEFDEKKRSCRKRLSEHNARRRKPRAEANQFTIGGSPLVSLAFNPPYFQTGLTSSPIWEGTGSRFTMTRDSAPCPVKRAAGNDHAKYLLGNGIPNNHRMISHGFHDSLPPQCTLPPPKVLNGVVGQYTKPSNIVEAHDFQSALSLLSSNGWGSSNSDSISAEHSNHLDNNMQLLMRHGAMESLPLASLALWKTRQQSNGSLAQHVSSESNDSHHLQEFKLFSDNFISSFQTHQLH